MNFNSVEAVGGWGTPGVSSTAQRQELCLAARAWLPAGAAAHLQCLQWILALLAAGAEVLKKHYLCVLLC